MPMMCSSKREVMKMVVYGAPNGIPNWDYYKKNKKG